MVWVLFDDEQKKNGDLAWQATTIQPRRLQLGSPIPPRVDARVEGQPFLFQSYQNGTTFHLELS